MQSFSILGFIDKAVKEVIGTYITKTPVLKDKKVNTEDFREFKDISVIIGLASEKLEGVFIVSYNKEVIFDFMASALGEKVEEVNQDVVDASGELTNQICGVFRRKFERTGISLQASVPSVVTGKNHSIRVPSKIARMVFCYQLDGSGAFTIEFGLVKK